MKSLSVVSPSPAKIVGLDEKRVSPASSVSSSTSFDSRSCSVRRETVDGNKLRSRLLNKLGIVQQPQGKKVARPPAVRKIAPISAPLKCDDATEATDCESLSTSSRRSVVAFDNEVSVVPIPRHQEYSERIRNSLWCDKQSMRIMVSRNTLEYQAEGWNPSTVVEDEGFITTASGERIHPVHLQRLLCSPFFRRGI